MREGKGEDQEEEAGSVQLWHRGQLLKGCELPTSDKIQDSLKAKGFTQGRMFRYDIYGSSVLMAG